MWPLKETKFGEYLLSNDRQKLDVNLIHRFLSEESYWMKGVPLERIRNYIPHSFCVGVYHPQHGQVAFCRLITDYQVIAYLADVFVLSPFRGQGISKKMMEYLFSFDEIYTLRGVLLGSKDARDLYSQFGFKALENPERFMAFRNENPYGLSQ